MKMLVDYVPKKLMAYYRRAYKDQDGYWFEFGADENDKVPRFYRTDCATVHEDTINECRVAMRDYEIVDDWEK